MGFLEDLIQTIQEAAAEARGEPPPNRPDRAPERQPTRSRPAAETTDAPRRGQRAEPSPAAYAPTPMSVANQPPRGAPARSASEHTAKTAVGDAARYRRLLHDPIYRRDLIVLKEILDRPLSLRRRR